jgi:long-subunit acyl-CoA synthetase (AMP-forming)
MSDMTDRATDAGSVSSRSVETVRRIARALTNAGIDADSRIAVVAATTDESQAVCYAAELLGAATVLCPDSRSPERLAEFVIQAGADTVVVFPELAEQAWLAIRSPQVRRVLGWGRVPGTDIDLAAAAARQSGAAALPSSGS